MNLKEQSKYFFVACFIGMILLAFLIVKPFLVAVLASIILTYVFYPIYRRVNKVIKNKNLCASLISLLVILMIIGPTLFAANAIINESVNFYHNVNDIEIEEISHAFSRYFGENIDLNFYFKEIVNNVSIAIMTGTSDFLLSIPQKLIVAFVVFFIMFYLFKDGDKLVAKVKRELPLKESHKASIAKKFNNMIYAMVYGLIVTAVIQGTIGAIGLWVFKVPSPILLGIVMIILAILPFVGAWLVWFPAAILQILRGDSFNGIGLLLYGFFIVSTIDNIIRPRLIGRRANIHPVLILLGVLGGIEMFGLIGIILGPLILAIFTVFLDIYLSEKHEIKS